MCKMSTFNSPKIKDRVEHADRRIYRTKFPCIGTIKLATQRHKSNKTF